MNKHTNGIGRRSFLALGAAGSLAAVGDPTKVPGTPPSALGQRASHAALARVPLAGVVSYTPLQDLHGTITPADLHFERHHAGIPDIDPAEHRLIIHGLVDKSLQFTVEELKRFPAETRTCFIECSGNASEYFQSSPEVTPQLLRGLTSQSEWTGVRLKTLFAEVGVKPEARWFLAEGSDAAVLTRSIPIEKAWDDALVVYAQNGEPLRPAQGYPIRLLLPGWEGNTCVKWLRRMELSTEPFMTREETSKYTDTLADGSIRQFSFVLGPNSIITSPAYPEALNTGWMEIRGLAWSGRGKVALVEVSTDGMKTWQEAKLQGPVLSKAHTRFRMGWQWDGKATQIASRCIDETGAVQPTHAALKQKRGVGTGYHINTIVVWNVAADGRMTFKTENWS